MKRNKLALISILVVLGVVLLVAIVDIPFFMDKISRGSSSLRENIISIAKVAIPLKDRILSRTVADKLARIHSTGACQFCDLTQANMEGMDLKGIDLRYANLARANLYGTNLTGANLRGANLSRILLRNTILKGSNLSEAELTFASLIWHDLRDVDLRGADLSSANLTGANLVGANLSGINLSGANLTFAHLKGAFLIDADITNARIDKENLDQAILCNTRTIDGTVSDCDLRKVDFTMTNLSGVDLRDKDLTGANLSGVDLSGKDLSGTTLVQSNLSGTNLSGVDLTGANLKGAKQIGIYIKEFRDFSEVTSFDLSGNVHYLTTKKGILYELQNEESTIALNLVNDAQFPFHDRGEGGLLSVVSNNKFVYISYTSEDYLVVDEYSKNFSNVRNIIKIETPEPVGDYKEEAHYGGTLVFDKHGRLYLSVGDGGNMDLPQNLKSLRGKILRLDVSKLKLEPEIVAYGLRNPWKVSIDSKNRMFIGDCGNSTVESVYLLNDLYSGMPYNLGWPVFEGTMRIGCQDCRLKVDPLMFKDTLAPIYEYERKGRPGCVIGGFYLDHLEVYLFGDLFGTLSLLKEQKNGGWYLYHYDKPVNAIWTFGYDEKTKKIFIGPNNFELIISIEPVKLDAQVNLCGTTMPNGSINNSGCQ